MWALIVAGRADPQARRVTDELKRRGADVVRLDSAAFPARTLLAARDGSYCLGRRALPSLHSIYVRGLATHPLTPGFEEDLAERPRGLLAQCDEKRALLESFLLDMESRGVRLVNGLEANAQHSRKPYQLGLLQRAGLPVPAWLATNDPKAVRRFARDAGPLIYKPLAGGASVRLLERADLTDERLGALSMAPVLFQARVEGVSVRAYVVGTVVAAAAEIHSPELDYRRAEERVVTTTLDTAEREAVLRAAEACGMAFTGVDLIRGEGGFVVLECNPSPMFALFERKTRCDVAGPLANLLMKERAEHPPL